MRIAYISYEYPPDSTNGGIATYIGQAAQTMARRGHEVEVFASSPSRHGRFEANGTIDHWIREGHRRDFGIVAGYAFAARHAEKPFNVLEGPEFNADARKAIELVPDIPLVVKMHTPSIMIAELDAPSGFISGLKNFLVNSRDMAGALARRKSLQPFFFTPPDIYEARKWDQVEAAHARKADIVAPPCLGLCDYAENVWKVSKDAIRHSPYPYNPRAEFLKLHPRPEGNTVGFVGRLEKRKGIETLTKAIPSVLNSVPEARFRFVGAVMKHPESGMKYDDWIRSQIPQHAARLDFAGKYPSDRMADAYGSLDICVFPSLWENFPNVCLEAMSAARAVIGSSAGGMSEMLEQGKVGRLIASGDASSMAREIISLLKAPAERIRLGELARKRVLAAYNESVIGARMEGIYNEAIARKSLKKQNNS